MLPHTPTPKKNNNAGKKTKQKKTNTKIKQNQEKKNTPHPKTKLETKENKSTKLTSPQTHTLLINHTRCNQDYFLFMKRPQFILKIANKLQKYFFITFIVINGTHVY